jgi:hypothetical protein
MTTSDNKRKEDKKMAAEEKLSLWEHLEVDYYRLREKGLAMIGASIALGGLLIYGAHGTVHALWPPAH